MYALDRRAETNRHTDHSTRLASHRHARHDETVLSVSRLLRWCELDSRQLKDCHRQKMWSLNTLIAIVQFTAARNAHTTQTALWIGHYSSESTSRNWRYSCTYNDFEDESRQNAGDYRQHSGNQQTEVLSHQQQAATLTPASGRIDAQVWAKIWGKRLKTASYCNVYSVLVSNRVSMTAAWFRVER